MTVVPNTLKGFGVTHVVHQTMPKVPAFVRPFVTGRAVAPAAVLTRDER